MRIRPAVAADAEAVSEIVRAAGVAAWSAFLGAERIEAGMRGARHRADLVAVDDEGVVAMVSWNAQTGVVGMLYTHPRGQGRGAGAALLERACDALRQAGHERARLYTEARNTGARRFYERQGWREDGPPRVRDWHGARLVEPRYVKDLHGVVATDGVRLAVTDFGGTAPDVLLLHGLAGYAGEWAPTALALADRARVVAFDARGHGASWAAPADVSRRAHVADAVAVITERRLAPAIVVGQSLGGITALLLAAGHPDLVRALVIVEAGPDCLGNAAAADGLAGRLSGWLAERPPSWPRPDGEVMARTLRESAGSYWDAWTSIRCPTLIVRAGADGLDAEYVSQMVSRLRTARAVTIDDAGHDVHLDQPERWHAELRAFVAEVTDR